MHSSLRCGFGKAIFSGFEGCGSVASSGYKCRGIISKGVPLARFSFHSAEAVLAIFASRLQATLRSLLLTSMSRTSMHTVQGIRFQSVPSTDGACSMRGPCGAIGGIAMHNCRPGRGVWQGGSPLVYGVQVLRGLRYFNFGSMRPSVYLWCSTINTAVCLNCNRLH